MDVICLLPCLGTSIMEEDNGQIHSSGNNIALELLVRGIARESTRNGSACMWNEGIKNG